MQSTLLLAAVLAPAAPAKASVTAKDMQVAGRLLGFISPPPSGTVKIGIVYDPADQASKADERALLGILGNGLTVAGVILVPVPVPIDKLASTEANMLFLTDGLGSSGTAVADIADAKKILCITTDTAAPKAGACAVAVQTAPTVEIIVRKSLLDSSGLSFSAAFLMMITEI